MGGASCRTGGASETWHDQWRVAWHRRDGGKRLLSANWLQRLNSSRRVATLSPCAARHK